MRKHSLIITITIIFTSVLFLATVAMAGDPFVGTWKLNLAKSKFPPGQALKSQTINNVAIDNGLKCSFEGVDAQGKAFHIEWSGKYDGKDYPISGDLTVDTSALKKIDANTLVRVDKKAGKEVVRYRVTVSKDGKTSTATGKGTDAKGQEYNGTWVYDKQ